MSICSRCGQQIEIRHVNGRRVPLHLEGNCGHASSRGPNDYTKRTVSFESTCFRTSCPECNKPVYFLRHNGGSVWLNPPLGYPWPKHPCLYNSNSVDSGGKRVIDDLESIAGYTGIKLGRESLLGIVKEAHVDKQKRFTDILFITKSSHQRSLRIKHNAGYLLGKLCIYDTTSKRIWPLQEPQYLFEEQSPSAPLPPPQLPRRPPISEKFKYIKCPYCNSTINAKNRARHYSRCQAKKRAGH